MGHFLNMLQIPYAIKWPQIKAFNHCIICRMLVILSWPLEKLSIDIRYFHDKTLMFPSLLHLSDSHANEDRRKKKYGLRIPLSSDVNLLQFFFPLLIPCRCRCLRSKSTLGWHHLITAKQLSEAFGN